MVHNSVTLHIYHGTIAIQSFSFLMNMNEMGWGGTTLLPMQLHVIIKYSSITLTYNKDVLLYIETNAHGCSLLHFHNG